MLPQPMIRDWARRLIASEVDADPHSARTELATLRVYEKLRRQLCAPVGVDGFQALASRALSLAKSQSPSLSAVQLTAKGSLDGFGEVPFKMDTDEDGEVGVILIAQLLKLCLTLLGMATTVRLIGVIPMQIDIETKSNTTGTGNFGTDTNYFGPFEGILLEADQLRHVSERLETLADTHVGIEEIASIAGNIRKIAAVLDVFTVIRNKTGVSQDNVLLPPVNGFLN
jgi:hypothetical protein